MENSTAYRTVTKEELEQLSPLSRNHNTDVPGEGTHMAYFRSENKNYKSLDFKMPQEIVDTLEPDTAKLEDLMDEACPLYVKAWKLADARCRELIQDGSAATRGKRYEYEHELSVIRIQLLEVKSKMEAVVYGQYEKGIATGKLPEQVVEPMEKALISYKTVGISFQEESLAKAQALEMELGRLLQNCDLNATEELADIVTECAKVQQKAYQATHPMHSITALRPFYDGTWSYRGNKVVDAEDYRFALHHDLAWTDTGARVSDQNNKLPEIPSRMRDEIQIEYRL